MVFRKRVIAPLAFAWTLAAAGMAAVAFSASPAAPSGITVEDVQIGERGDQTRIAFLCSAACVLDRRGDVFVLASVDASFEIDLSASSDRVKSVSATPGEGGAVLSVATDAPPERSAAKACRIGGRPAACLDLFFAAAQPDAAAENSGDAQAPSGPAPPADAAPSEARIVQPALREADAGRLIRFSALAAPERISPPSGAILAKVQPIEKSIEVGKPSIREDAPVSAPEGADFAARVRAILGKELTSAYCNNAEATLQADAWALGAMVDVGLCSAARGDVVDADALLARLLEFTPDNYEALVGRAIIAELAQEKGVARKYYQDALNALPPIPESERIVNAMAALE